MTLRRILALTIALTTALALGSCGHVADLAPSKGHSLPVKPLMARATPTSNDLLAIPTYAKPDRVDELMSRSEPRPQDPFDLPPASGGAAPSLPPGSETQPAMNQTAPTGPAPTNPGD